MARALKTPRERRARDHAVKCRQTWRPHFQNLFIAKVAKISSGFRTFIDQRKHPNYSAAFEEKSTRYVGV